MRRVSRSAIVLVGGSGLLCSTAVSSAALVHSYTFNSGTANDSVGTANGTLVVGATAGNATIANGRLTTNITATTNNDFVTLPSTVGSGITNTFSLEAFTTIPAATTNYAPLISLSSNTSNFLLIQPSPGRNGGALNAAFLDKADDATDGEFDVFSSGVLFPFGTAEHLITLTDTAGAVALYLDGSQIASGTGSTLASFNLSNVSNGGNDGINGNGPFGDNSLNGSTDEFRVYNTALSAAQVAADFAAGPTPVPEPASVGALAVLGTLAAVRRHRRA